MTAYTITYREELYFIRNISLLSHFLPGQLTDREQKDIGVALFTREYGRTASYYNDNQFIPNFLREPVDFLPVNRSYDVARAIEICQDSYQCRYDYGMTLNRDMAEFTKNYLASIVSGLNYYLIYN